MRYALLLSCLTMALAAACVTSGNYEAVYADLTETKRQMRADVASRDAQLNELQARVAESESREEELATSEAELQQQLSATSVALETAQKEGSANEEELARLSAEREQLATKLNGVESDRAELKETSVRMRKELGELSARQAEMDKQVKEYRQLIDRFSTMVDAGDLQVKVEGGRMVLALPSDIMFGSASAELSEHGIEALKQVAAVLKSVKGKSFQVEGHTDALPIHTEEFPSNWHLAAARALVVLDAMIAAGVPAKRLSAASFAEHRPVRSNKTSQGRAVNRRIEIVLVPYVSAVAKKR